MVLIDGWLPYQSIENTCTMPIATVSVEATWMDVRSPASVVFVPLEASVRRSWHVVRMYFFL